MLEFEDYVDVKPAVIKHECSDEAEDVDENITSCLKSEEISRIKCEEIDIKEESDTEAEIRNDNVASSNRNIGKSGLEGKKHLCPKCPYSANRKYNITKHMHLHSDNKPHKCLLCAYVAENRLSLRAHMSSHKGPTKEFTCHICHHKTGFSHSLKRHILRHKDTLEVETYKCPLCPFVSKYKSALAAHWKLQHDKNIKVYKCEECSLTTKYRKSFLRHQLVHEDSTVVNKFKCEKCPYWSKRQCDLKKHMRTHPAELLCNDLQVYKCELCSYQAKTTNAFKAHMTKTHPDPLNMPQKCAYCPYETTLKHLLSKHTNRQHSDKNQSMLKCTLCPYTTTQRKRMQSHSSIHQEATFQCDLVPFPDKAHQK